MIRARLRSAFRSPLDWDPADKCLLAALVVLPFVVWYAWLAWWVPQHPELVGYVDSWFITTVIFPIQVTVIIPVWATIAVIAYRSRGGRGDVTLLFHVICQLFFGWFGYISYGLGSNTSLYPAIILLGGATFGLALFPTWPVLLGIGTFVLILCSSLALAQLGLIRYAPILTRAPFQDGRIEPSWIWGVGGAEFAALGVGLVLIYYVIDRWHDREAEFGRIATLIRQYVPRQVADEITAGNYATVNAHDWRIVTVVFVDVRDFSGLSGTLEPSQLATLINRYFMEMAAIADRHGGTIDKFIGDAVMILFGAPLVSRPNEQAQRAIEMALEMQRRMSDWAHEEQQGGTEAVQIRIGINTGGVTVGNFGSPGRMTYTAIGAAVNVAAHLQTVCRPGHVLISDATWQRVREDIPCTGRGTVDVRGMRQAIETYEVEAH